ncbi:hypothetical protein OJ996_10035 [Luteolibacter sp. GHJ8]|jgi:hypothetical protein|uniref:Uncharacterized protein n=1 Tax=Luteolibacter rhizosphaerae TaxID=2989719 RepID=A0ABT3G254_9BACT|nr:hypothetical protein [Luteolibacter rhizosphaerae]MCW1913915.1 hypothetical protein [Luteolibacter rhizosphaerae]
MKAAALLILSAVLATAEEEKADLATKIAQHQEGARELAEKQDELAADVQQLIIEQTQPTVIELLEGVNDAMDEASGMLLEHDTGGVTIAAETDVIEKIFAAAKERQKQQQSENGQQQGESGGAMMDMMQRMLGMSPDGEQPGGQPGGKPSQQGDGEGSTGLSDTANGANGGAAAGGKTEERRVPKASGTAGQALPKEFQQALDAYNREAEKLAK